MGAENQKQTMPLSKEGAVAHNLTFQMSELGRAYRIFCFLMTRDSKNFKFRGTTFLLSFRTVWARLESSVKIYYLVSARQSLQMKVSNETDHLAFKILTKGHRYISTISAENVFDIPVPIFTTDDAKESIKPALADDNPRPLKILRQ